MRFTDYDTRVAAYAVVVEDDRILLAWFRGSDRDPAGWTLPGGGVDFEETLEEAVVREVFEETGLHVEVGAPLTTQSFVLPAGEVTPRPYKAVKVVYAARVTGGVLGTTEVGGSTERAAWIPLAEVADHATRSDVVDAGLAAHSAGSV